MTTEMNLSKLTKKELIKEVLDWKNISNGTTSIICEKNRQIKNLQEQMKVKSDYNTIMTEEFDLKDEEIKKLKEKIRELNLDKIKKEVEDEAEIEMLKEENEKKDTQYEKLQAENDMFISKNCELKDEIKQLQHDFDSDEKNMHYKKMSEELEKVKPIITHLMDTGIIESLGNGKQIYHKGIIDNCGFNSKNYSYQY